MNTNNAIYETGATSHAVNDLIFFTDNTKSLAELRDKIYKEWADQKNHPVANNFLPLLDAAQLQYYREFKTSHMHITNMTPVENGEYCRLYAADFENWKLEHGYK